MWAKNLYLKRRNPEHEISLSRLAVRWMMLTIALCFMTAYIASWRMQTAVGYSSARGPASFALFNACGSLTLHIILPDSNAGLQPTWMRKHLLGDRNHPCWITNISLDSININWKSVTFWNWLGFGYERQQGPYGLAAQLYAVSVPHWLFAALAVVVGWRLRPHPERIGLCHNCGYDLRATPCFCPECGSRHGEKEHGKVDTTILKKWGAEK